LEEGRFIEVNDAFVSISGFTRQEALSNSINATHTWVDIEERNLVISTLLDGRLVSGKEFLFKKKNGEIMTGLFSAKILHINKEPYMISSIDDITESKQATNLLHESERKSHSIMENSADAIFVTNQQGQYLYSNKEATAMLGYTTEEMKRKTIADISPPDKREEYFKFFYKIMNEGKGYTEIELLKKDGNYISTDLNAVLLPDGTIYGSCRDITERKLAESELIKAKEKAE
jgi:PAS domain S-box-containing protein